MERPQLCSAVRYYVVHLGGIKADLLASPDGIDPTIGAREFQRTCAPPPEEELFVEAILI